MELKQYFIDHILHDKEFVQDIIERYKSVVDQVSERLLSHKKEMWGRDTDFMREFYDFIDGNGFVVEVDKERFEKHNEFYIKMTVIYEEEEEEENEPPTIDWSSCTWTSFSEYYTTAEETYTQAKEENTRQDTSAPLWFYSNGCLELLRMVPSRGRLCAKVPRPP